MQRNTKLQGIEGAIHSSKYEENDRSLLNRSHSSHRVPKGDRYSKEYREKQKQEIKEWKAKKAEIAKLKNKDLESKKNQLKIKKREREKEELEWKAHKVKQYQLQKELKEEQKKEIQKLERIKKRQKFEQDQATRERIFKREEDLFRKRAELVIGKKCIEEEQLMRLERTKLMLQESKYDKIESRLNKVTTAAKGKNREKFKAGVDAKKDAMTFGGNIIVPTIRAQPSWRKGL